MKRLLHVTFAVTGLIVRFTRAADGRVGVFNLSAPPARRVLFEKHKN